MRTGHWAPGMGLGVLLAAVSCGPRYDIATGPLSGKIGGQSWTVLTAQTDALLSTADQLSATMYAETFAACSSTPASGNRLVMGIPTVPGDYELSSSLSATFVVAEGNQHQNVITSRGRLKVDAFTATAVTASAYVEGDDDNVVSGVFQIAICP